MATATRKRATAKRATTTATRRRAAVAGRRNSSATAGRIANFAVPLVFCLGILFCLGFLGLMGYRTVTASDFFDVKTVEVRGATRISQDDVQKIVSSQTEKTGVWNADLNEIKSRVEKINYVKSAAVSRILPDGIRVYINERIPKAAVHLDTGDVWVDDEGAVLGAIGKSDGKPALLMRGWDISRSDESVKPNQSRVKMYLKMLDDWREFDLIKRVKEIQLDDLDDPKAVVEDAGQNITIHLGHDYSSKRLQKGLETVAGHGKEISGLNMRENKVEYIYKEGGNQ